MTITSGACFGPTSDVDRLRVILRALRSRRENLRELIGTVRKLEAELDAEVVEIQALAAEGRLIMRARRAAP